MERGEPSLKPEWLLRGSSTVPATALRPVTSSRTDDQSRGSSSRTRSSGRERDRNSQQSASRRGSVSSGSRRNDRDSIGKSRGYASFGRNNRERVPEKDVDLRDRESRLVHPEDPLRDGFESFSSCRPEKDRLNRSRSKVAVPNRAGVNLDNGNASRKDAGGITFEREFPHLGTEDKNGKQDVGRVPSPGISNPIQSIPLVNAPDVWTSVLVEVPTLSDPNNNHISSSLSPIASSKQAEVFNSGSALSMAETVMHSPSKISTTPQLSIDAQKIEERTMRQCTLRPLTPSSNKVSVSGSSDKLKPKGVRVVESNGLIKAATQLSVQPSSSSVRTPARSELAKPTPSGNLQVLSREQNGTVNTAKDCATNPLGPVLGRSSSMEPMRKAAVSQKLKVAGNGLSLHLLQGSFGERKASAKDKHKFFELLRSKSVNGSSTSIESSSNLIDEQQNTCLDLSMFNSGIKCIENGSSSCEEANSCEGSQQHSSDNEEIILPSESRDVLDEGSLGILADNRGASSSMLTDTEDVDSKKPQPNEAEDILSLIPAYIHDGSVMSNSIENEANLPLQPIGTEGEEAYPAQESEHIGAKKDEELYFAQDKPSPEELAFLISCGWDENEEVPPLLQEEIADCVRQNVRLKQKLQEC